MELKEIDEKIISDLIGKTVVGILSIPELSCLPRYNREDAVSAIASEVVELLKNLGIPVTLKTVADSVSTEYRKSYRVGEYNNNLVQSSKASQ